MSEAIINKRKETWKKFIDLNSSLNNVYIIHYMPDVLTRPQLWPSKKNERIEWAWRMYSLHMERIEWLDDDSIPYLDMLTGTEIFAEAFGCKVHRDENNMPFALPLIKQASDVSRLKVPDLWDSTLAYLFEMADELKRRAGKGALLRMVDIQSPIDIAALIFDKNYFYIA
jgi:uroporphyrinogen-III decarboxylase